MADKRISALPQATSLLGNELLPLVQDGATRRAKVNQLAASIGAVYGLSAPQTTTGIPGAVGFGVAAYPGALPAGFTAPVGHDVPSSDHYGNYIFSDGSVVAWIPRFYYRYGHPDNPTYPTFGANSIDVKGTDAFASEAEANAAGYALPYRAFVNGGEDKAGFFYDKYRPSNNGGIASSIRYGAPLSTNAAHNPISALNGAPANTYAGCIDAIKTRNTAEVRWHNATRFQRVALALLSLAHAQAATSATYCAWYDATGTTNYPKGCNNNALGDVDDPEIAYISDGYENCGQTGSGTPFAKTTHNGQACGIADLNGLMWEVNLGLVRPGASAGDVAQQDDATAFYVLKPEVDVADLTSGWTAGDTGSLDAWGDADHLATLYDPITLAHIGNGSGWRVFGNGSEQVLDPALSGDGHRQTGLGIYAALGEGAGTNLFGNDGLYEYHRANLCVISGAYWYGAGQAGPWALHLSSHRSNSYTNTGPRAAAYV